VVVVSAAAAAGSSPTGSSPVTLACGQTVTTSVTLASDLLNCPGNGLVIGAAGITIDLGGHTLSGSNAAKSAGITNNGHWNIAIVNGTITGFQRYGIVSRQAPGTTIRKVTIRAIGAGTKENEPAAGILLDHSPGSLVAQSDVTNHVHAYQADGVDVINSGRTGIVRNRLSRNAWNGLVVVQSASSEVSGNQLDGNGNNGLEANAGSDGVFVSKNTAAHNKSWGIVVGALGQAKVIANVVAGSGRDGFLFFDLLSSVVKGNRSSGNATGFSLSGGQHGSSLVRLLGNTASNNKHQGIWVNGQNAKSPADDNVVSGNRATRNGKEGGIVIDGTARRNTLRRNTANANRGSGIMAVTGTIDAGGNRARGNAHAPQCVGVACS